MKLDFSDLVTAVISNTFSGKARQHFSKMERPPRHWIFPQESKEKKQSEGIINQGIQSPTEALAHIGKACGTIHNVICSRRVNVFLLQLTKNPIALRG